MSCNTNIKKSRYNRNKEINCMVKKVNHNLTILKVGFDASHENSSKYRKQRREMRRKTDTSTFGDLQNFFFNNRTHERNLKQRN